MMKLNCDLGESFGAWQIGLDEQVMPVIDQANIACGFHAGDPLVMQNTLKLAKQHQVTIGAHPSYPDLVGFGRRSMKCDHQELQALLHYQIAAIDGMAQVHGLQLNYVKPHGALYNDMMVDKQMRLVIIKAIALYPRPLVLMLQATPEIEQYRAEAKAFGVSLWAEAFADRCYDDNGRLLARNKAGAVHNKEKMLAQVRQLQEEGSITTVSGKVLKLSPDTLCVHGDNMEAVQAIKEIKALITP